MRFNSIKSDAIPSDFDFSNSMKGESKWKLKKKQSSLRISTGQRQH